MFSTSNTFIQFMYTHVNVNYRFCMVSSFTVLDMLDVMSWFGVGLIEQGSQMCLYLGLLLL